MATKNSYSGHDLLAVAGLKVTNSRAKGRYWLAAGRWPNVHFWATSTPRYGTDHFGVQFIGKPGAHLAGKLADRLEDEGFCRRNDVAGSVTFARRIKQAHDGTIAKEQIADARHDIEQIMKSLDQQMSESGGDARLKSTEGERSSHVQNPFAFIRNSTPVRLDLELPSRADELGDRVTF